MAGPGRLGCAIVAVDGSEESMNALRWALDNIKLRSPAPDSDSDSDSGGHFLILYIQSPPNNVTGLNPGAMPFGGPIGYMPVPALTAAIESHQRRVSEAILAHALQICSDKNVTNVQTQVIVGDPKEKICEAVDNLHADLLVMGCRAFGPIKRITMSTSEQVSHSAKAKPKAPRRNWKGAEEDLLIKSMREIYCDKWKADNGFKPGFFVAVEKEILRALPGTDLRASPHIESKIKFMKGQYNMLSDILRLSGFAWNNITHSIVVDEPSIWDEYEKANPKAKGVNGKSFPYYNDWQILFGKDRATGELAEDAPDAETNLDKEEDVNPLFQDCYNPILNESHFVDFCFSENGDGSTPTTNAERKKSKKRAKRVVEESSMNEPFGNWLNDTKDTLSAMAKSMGYSQELSISRKKVYNELEKIDLTTKQRFKASALIMVAEERVDNFLVIPDNQKKEWVLALLDGDIYPLT